MSEGNLASNKLFRVFKWLRHEQHVLIFVTMTVEKVSVLLMLQQLPKFSIPLLLWFDVTSHPDILPPFFI